jgi:hypothetical protein
VEQVFGSTDSGSTTNIGNDVACAIDVAKRNKSERPNDFSKVKPPLSLPGTPLNPMTIEYSTD